MNNSVHITIEKPLPLYRKEKIKINHSVLLKRYIYSFYIEDYVVGVEPNTYEDAMSVFSLLLQHANDSFFSNITVKEMKKRLNFSLSYINKLIKILASAGLILIPRTRGFLILEKPALPGPFPLSLY